MKDEKRTRFRLEPIDWILIGAVVVLFFVCTILPGLSPTWWGRCLWLLDLRVWPPWKCFVMVVVVLQAVLLIRFWPEK
jgi:hypothetical protein